LHQAGVCLTSDAGLARVEVTERADLKITNPGLAGGVGLALPCALPLQW
jgi:hypothetical protein